MSTNPVTQAELDRLAEMFRRDPGSFACVQLGDAYLALGRPREAVDVGAKGVRANSKNIEIRVMVGRAFAAMHQWKEAQTELLKVVKADRNHRLGFRLLGEVLMRRADYERALPVLQHAQNLDPADPSILAMLKRARAGQPLDPPPPIPTPQAPTGNAAVEDAGPTMQMPSFDESKPAVAEPDYPRAAQLPIPPAANRTLAAAAPPAAARNPAPPAAKKPPPPAARNPAPPAANKPPPPAAKNPAPPAASSKPPTAAIRPRVLPAHKPQDGAREALHQSVAAGERYLNDLLTGGLLQLPNVRASDIRYDPTPKTHWGRGSRRVFFYLFGLIAILGAVGAGWFFYTEHQREQDVARHIGAASDLVATGSYADVKKAVAEATEAVNRDRESIRALAAYAAAAGIETLLYGETPTADIRYAITVAEKDVTGPEHASYRPLLIGDAAVTLATLADTEDPVSELATIQEALSAHLEKAPDDHLARWLAGRAYLAAGDPKRAREAFERADNDGKGSVLAALALANLTLDAGDIDAAEEAYEAVLERAPDHPLAIVGASLVISEAAGEPAEALGKISVGLAEPMGPKVAAQKNIALALAHYTFENYTEMAEAVANAESTTQPRFLARLGLAKLRLGDIKGAAETRVRIRWYAKSPTPGALAAILDAELLLARGRPKAALAGLEGRHGLRVHIARGRALFLLGKLDDAIAQLEAATEIAPDWLVAHAWLAAARLAAGGKGARDADEELSSLARQSKSKLARLAHGLALLRAGRTAKAREMLTLSIEDVTAETPAPLAYLAHVALARLALEGGKLKPAKEHAAAALSQNPGYLPAAEINGRVALAAGNTDAALEALAPVAEADALSGPGWLAFAAALAANGDDAAAEKALSSARAAGADAEAVARTQALLSGSE